MIDLIRDGISFISTLTFRKVWNALRLFYSFYLSRLKGRPLLSGMPAAISIEPTTSCNLRCPHCPSGLRSFTRPTGILDLDLYKSIIDQLKGHLAYLLLYFQGEPFLHPGFVELVQYAREKHIYTATSTNGHYLDEKTAEAVVRSGLDRLIISLDGVTQDVYEKYRVGGKIDQVILGIENLRKAKEKQKSHKPYIVIQFLAFSHNLHQLDEIKRLARRWKVKLAIKTAQVYDVTNDSGMIPAGTLYSRYSQNVEGGYELKNRLYNHCWKMWHSSVITWDGLVVPCCFDKDADYKMGSLANGSFREIWFGEGYGKFRKQILSGRKEIDICRNCSEGSKVWI
jgi:radical SAM protein with 4Fe4S-binding SPASM domain